MPDAEPCKTLAEALAQLQARLPRVAKTADAQYGKYADLTMVSEALLPLLAGLGMSWSCRPTMEDGQFVLAYHLTHISGDENSGYYPLPAGGTPQQIGSAITYARRYALCAVTGCAPGGDDDEASAAEREHLRRAVTAEEKARAKTSHLQAGTSRMARAQEEDPWAQDAPVDHERAAGMRQTLADAAAEDQPGSSNSKQWQQLAILYGQIGLGDRELRLADLQDRFGREFTSAKDLSYAEAEQAIRMLRGLAAKEGATT
jgi:ERF superfamily